MVGTLLRSINILKIVSCARTNNNNSITPSVFGQRSQYLLWLCFMMRARIFTTALLHALVQCMKIVLYAGFTTFRVWNYRWGTRHVVSETRLATALFGRERFFLIRGKRNKSREIARARAPPLECGPGVMENKKQNRKNYDGFEVGRRITRTLHVGKYGVMHWRIKADSCV